MPKNTSGLNRGGPGRPVGTPNKATGHAREAIARLVDENAPRLMEWLEQIAEKDGPKAAFVCMMDVMEYHVPKLARTELVGKDGADLLPKVVVLKVEP
jgi:hypothetical protein